MSRSWVGVPALLALTLAGAAFVDRPTLDSSARPLPDLLPAGPVLVIQARDFASIVQDWNESAEKRLWLDSSNYAAFSRSRLYLRLKDAQAEFAAAAGLPPDMSLAKSAAGGESALGLYDVGKLEFLYLTRMPEAHAVESALWRARGNYEPRESAGQKYFVHIDSSSRRVVAFAVTGDLLLLSTRQDLMAGALAAMAGKTQTAVGTEPWFRDAIQAAKAASPDAQPDLRLVLDLPVIVKSPYFRSYWVQGNVAELRQYRAAITDLYRSKDEIREQRVLLRGADVASVQASQAGGTDQPAAAADHQAALAGLLRLAPPDAGFYRAWAAPSTDAALALLEQKVLAPRTGPLPAGSMAPAVSSLEGGEAGAESDLETRIDDAPALTSQDRFGREVLRQWLGGSKIESALEIEMSEPSADGVFIRTPSAVAFLAASDWDGERARTAIQAAIQRLWTTSRLGVAWVEHRRGSESAYELDGLARLSVAARGRTLIVSNDAPLLGAMLARVSNASAQDAATLRNEVYVANFNHAREAGAFASMVRLIDAPNARPQPEARSAEAGAPLAATAAVGASLGREPLFFSENIASLSRTLARVQSASIVIDDRGSEVEETVIYRLKQ